MESSKIYNIIFTMKGVTSKQKADVLDIVLSTIEEDMSDDVIIDVINNAVSEVTGT